MIAADLEIVAFHILPQLLLADGLTHPLVGVHVLVDVEITAEDAFGAFFIMLDFILSFCDCKDTTFFRYGNMNLILATLWPTAQGEQE